MTTYLKASPAPTRARDSRPNFPQQGINQVTQTLHEGTSKRQSSRIRIDSLRMLWFTVGLVGFLAVASFLVSFAGLVEVAVWVGVPPWMRWAIPVFVDVAILAYSLAVLIHRSRGDQTWPSWISLGGFTAVSVVANASHAFSVDHSVAWQSWIGAGLAALAPVAIFTATEELGRLAVERPDHHATGPEAASVEMPDPASNSHEEGSTTDHGSFRHDTAVDKKEQSTIHYMEDTDPSAAVAGSSTASTELVHEERTVDSTHKAAGAKVTEIDQLTRWVCTEVEEGRAPASKAAADLLGVSDRTARRKLAVLKDSRPDLFEIEVEGIQA